MEMMLWWIIPTGNNELLLVEPNAIAASTFCSEIECHGLFIAVVVTSDGSRDLRAMVVDDSVEGTQMLLQNRLHWAKMEDEMKLSRHRWWCRGRGV